MIEFNDGLYIGSSFVVEHEDLSEIGALLNVAHDLPMMVGWPDVEYAQVGLINGPGNEITDYAAAVLCLKVLRRRHDKVLVYDHEGNIAFVVALMYLNLTEGQRRPNPIKWSHWPTWQERIDELNAKLRYNIDRIHPEHIKAFDMMRWGAMEPL